MYEAPAVAMDQTERSKLRGPAYNSPTEQRGLDENLRPSVDSELRIFQSHFNVSM